MLGGGAACWTHPRRDGSMTGPGPSPFHVSPRLSPNDLAAARHIAHMFIAMHPKSTTDLLSEAANRAGPLRSLFRARFAHRDPVTRRMVLEVILGMLAPPKEANAPTDAMTNAKIQE